MYGITEAGHSVMMHIHNFLSYLYVEVNDKLTLGENDLNTIKDHINKKLSGMTNGVQVVDHIEVVERASVYYYQEKMSSFLKIFCALPTFINKVRALFEKQEIGFGKLGSGAFGSVTFESNMPFALRFMIDNNISGMQWIQVLAGKYLLRSQATKDSTCQFEIDILDFRDVMGIPLDQKDGIAPLRILSFDIECQAPRGRFPVATQDPVIQIANIVKVHGESEPFVRNIFTLKKCAPIVGTKVFSYEKEADLLKAWRDFVQ